MTTNKENHADVGGMLWRLPWIWYMLLGLIALLGILLIKFNPPLPILEIMNKRITANLLSRFIGAFLISIVLTHLLIFFPSRILRVILNFNKGQETYADLYSPALVGLCESILYPIAFLSGEFEFVGLWLAVKVAGQWVRWSGNEPSRSEIRYDSVETSFERNYIEYLHQGRRRFNGFLIGNSLSIMAGLITSLILRTYIISPV